MRALSPNQARIIGDWANVSRQIAAALPRRIRHRVVVELATQIRQRRQDLRHHFAQDRVVRQVRQTQRQLPVVRFRAVAVPDLRALRRLRIQARRFRLIAVVDLIGLSRLRIQPRRFRLIAVLDLTALSRLRIRPRFFRVVPRIDPRLTNPARFARIGRDIDAGIARGVIRNRAIVNNAVMRVVDQAFETAQTVAESRSPSRRAEREIGRPFAEGIAQGIDRNKIKAIRAASNLTLELFSGPVVGKLAAGVRATGAQLQQDLRQQTANIATFSNSLVALARRGAPRQLLAQLAQLGPDAAQNIQALSRMSQPELDKYIETWRRAMALVEDATNKTGDNIAKTLPQSVQNARQTLQSALQGLQQMFDNFLQQEQGFFGELFQGPVIQGAAVQNKLDWGGVLNTQDLIRDLRGQISAFQNWHRQLNRLARRGLPPGLINQILQLGPQASSQAVAALSRATPAQLRQYARLWQRGQRLIHQQAQRDLNRQLAIYRRFGQKVALAIIAGIRSENVGLERALRIMLARLFPELFRRARVSLPRDHPATRRRPNPRNTRASVQGGRTTYNVHNDNRMTVHANKDESLATTLRRAQFRRTQKRKK